MPKRRGDFNKRLFTIFLIAVGVRVFLDLVFFLLYGFHAVNHAELWLYYGVASGTHVTAEGLRDPTVGFMRLIGSALDGDALFYGIVLLSALLTAAAAVLIALIVRRLHSEKAGYYAGFIYAFMVEPLNLSLVGFTHDHLLTPLMLLIVLLTVTATYSARWRTRMFLVLVAAIVLYFASRVHMGAYVAAGVSLVHVVGRLINRVPKYHPHYAIILVSVLFLGGTCILSDYMNQELGALPQGRTGSEDVKPVTFENLFMRYNILLILLPFGVAEAYRKRDYATLSFAAVGLVFASMMDRGTRISDIGFAALCAYSLVSVKRIEKRTAMGLALAFLAVSALLKLPATLGLLIASSGILLLILLHKAKKKIRYAIHLIAVTGIALTVASMHINTNAVISDIQYQLYSELMRQLPGDTVLADWGDGFMLEALSGKKAASSAARIEYGAHGALWLTEKQAASALHSLGIDYVILSDRHYNLVEVDGLPYYLLEGGLVFPPKHSPKAVTAQHLAVTKLRQGTTDPKLFDPVAEVRDSHISKTFLVYKVMDPGEEGTLVSFVAKNNEEADMDENVEITVLVYPEGASGIKRAHLPLTSFILPFGKMRCILKSLMYLTGASVLFALAYSLTIKVRKGRAAKRRLARITGIALLGFAITATLHFAPEPSTAEEQPAVSRDPKWPATTHTFSVSMKNSSVELFEFDVGRKEDIVNCEVSVSDGPLNEFSGSVRFRSLCDGVNETATVLLIDRLASSYAGSIMVEDEYNVSLVLDKGQDMKVDYSFTREHPHHEYFAAFAKSDCIRTSGEPSWVGKAKGVDVLTVFCPMRVSKDDFTKFE